MDLIMVSYHSIKQSLISRFHTCNWEFVLSELFTLKFYFVFHKSMLSSSSKRKREKKTPSVKMNTMNFKVDVILSQKKNKKKFSAYIL